MSFKSTLFAATAAIAIATTAFAGDTIMIKDSYARSSTAKSTSGAAFMVLMNMGAEDDRLIAASSDAAKKIELHTHIENSDGVMQMVHVEEGFVIEAGASHALERGGDHVMFMGLTDGMEQGDMISLTLTFEKAGDITIDVPVDLARKPGKHGHNMKKMSDG